MPSVPFWAVPAAVLVGIAVGWILTAESRRLAHEDKQAWRQQCLDANRRAGDLQRQVVRLHRRYRPVGFAPYAKPGPAANGWPDPEPGELIRRGPDPTTPTTAVVRGLPAKPARPVTAPAWCYENPDPDGPDEPVVGGIQQWDRRFFVTSEVALPWLVSA